MNLKKVIILDDHTLFLKGMTLILKEYCKDCDVYPYYSIKKLKSDNIDFSDIDLLISDIELPEEDAFDLFKVLRDNVPELPILVVSMHKKNAIIKKCKLIGIQGYLLKDEDDQLIKAIETIINGKEYYSKTITDFCNKTKNYIENLSSREEEIIKLIAKGINNKDIADKLFISVETIKTHKKNIKLKLGLNTSTEIIEYANKSFLM